MTSSINQTDSIIKDKLNWISKPLLGVNYGLEELLYVTSPTMADAITDEIIYYARKIKLKNYNIHDAAAGIGGNTHSFASNRTQSRFIYAIHAYEIIGSRRKMLEVNMKGYSKVHVHEQFDMKHIKTGDVVYMDFPWMKKEEPKEEKEGKETITYTKNDYILEDAVFAGHKIHEWLGLLQMCSIVIYRAPPGYEFPMKIEGWRIIIKDALNKKRNSRVIIALNNEFFRKKKDASVVSNANMSTNNYIVGTGIVGGTTVLSLGTSSGGIGTYILSGSAGTDDEFSGAPAQF